ncbi:FkbM family methyltransferase [Saccharopolyspora erythraea NRRL 2338]|uniref:Methyltransferase FkbM domain-containing protein n=2 Tax=Saccharopolyspora erythraea TaxID=1836 RepID=A4FA59_SACEN|nr:FkbM family methyltransferase [Saccharopolyspora erythraea]EQD83639.1 hypothetical protein N599_24095 [Saccharopolyspora erythraea D]PFG94721.1 FkbM family methyltransferase [Saccharopolyspora erythraea NRRL 2338]QRK91443.1 FkbM family methyltransferase [Saccharopolyspora erythraea]CAM00934.1 hypothetical protein SACE_1614 [Saccharopolyspora erythraea NRRL 2338]
MTDSQAHPDPVASGGRSPESSLQSGVLEQQAETFAEPEWPSEVPEEDDLASGTLVACTVACHGQLPAARVLRDSFLRRHPGSEFVLLLVDHPGTDERDVVSPADIGVRAADFARLAVACTAEQLRAVLRPRLLAHLLESGSTVLYFEPTVQVFGAFDDLLEPLTRDRPVALVPRVLRPLHLDGLRPSPADLAGSGTFDPSVFAVRPGAEGLLATWADQVQADPSASGSFLDSAPALVDHKVVRDPGVGLSVWNAAQRELTATDDGLHKVDGHELRSVHFDGFQPQRPWLLSADYADRPRVLLSENPVLAGLCAGYRNALVAAGYTREQPHPFDALPDGIVLPQALREEYRAAWVRGEEPPSPFQPGEADPPTAFLDWAYAPADDDQEAAGASRWTTAVWKSDPVLRRDYPDPFGADAEAFREWCVGVGVASGRVPAAAVHRRTDRGRAALVDQLGVAVLGSGRLAELVRAAVATSGLPSADTPYYPVVLRCEPGIPVPSGRHVIDVRPDATSELPDEVAEVWVPSETARADARRNGGRTARVIALPLPDPGRVGLPGRKGARARHGLSDEFVIGAFADHSEERQDNVLGLVSAFLAAFPEQEDVRLLIGVDSASRHPESAERLRLATAGDPRVMLVEEDLDRGALLAASDCVASLHRAESGDRHALRLLEVAAHGVPVIAGDHGAVAELLGQEGARLVPCQGAGEPDVDAAAEVLREAAAAPEEIAEFGLRAREHLLERHNATHAGERLRDRVEHAYRNWRTKWAQDRHGQFDDPLRPLLVARHALHRAPDVGVGSRNSMAPALRKAVLKVLSHYDEHIRDVMRSLVDGVEQTAAELLRRQYDADGDLDIDSLRSELTRINQRQDQLDAQLMGTDDGMVRARADLADQHRRLRGLEENQGSGESSDVLAQRIDSLTSAVERTLDRIDALERKHADSAASAAVKTASHDAAHALQRTDVLERILLREHERNTGGGDGTTAPVLCDAGLLRLPADDSLMLPWLSSHATWDADTSALIDSLLEPDGIFVDVGAYVGYQSVRVLSRLGNSGAVVAVEPCRRSQELLRHNIEVNVPSAWGNRLVVVDGAAWDGACELASEPALAGGMSIRPVDEAEQPAEKVRGVRLDKELENHAQLSDMRLSVVHVDVGGSVHRALGGLVRLLRRDRPSIVCSFTPAAIGRLGDDPAAALREFGTWGYELVPVGRTQPVPAAELLEAIEAAASTSTVKLWLRPKGR